MGIFSPKWALLFSAVLTSAGVFSCTVWLRGGIRLPLPVKAGPKPLPAAVIFPAKKAGCCSGCVHTIAGARRSRVSGSGGDQPVSD